MPPRQRAEAPIKISVYKHTGYSRAHERDYQQYSFFAHRGFTREHEADAKHMISSGLSDVNPKFVKVLAAPAHMQKELGEMLDKQGFAPIGHIKYTFDEDVAVSSDYKPKYHAHPEDLKGFGYYIEGHALQDLEKNGTTHTRSTPIPDTGRKMMLESVGLPKNQPVPIPAWRTRLLIGFRGAARKYGTRGRTV